MSQAYSTKDENEEGGNASIPYALNNEEEDSHVPIHLQLSQPDQNLWETRNSKRFKVINIISHHRKSKGKGEKG